MFIVSCENLDSQSKYLPYLHIESFDTSKMTNKDLKTISEAIKRLDIISTKYGVCIIGQSRGKDVNISEELYKFIEENLNYTNEFVKKQHTTKSIPQDNENKRDSTFCVAHALAGMGGVTFNEVKNYIIDNYGYNGVPSFAIDSVVYHFYPSAKSFNCSVGGGAMDNSFIYFQTSDSTGHAVNGFFYDKETNYILYKDLQSNRTGIIHRDSCMQIYTKGLQ